MRLEHRDHALVGPVQVLDDDESPADAAASAVTKRGQARAISSPTRSGSSWSSGLSGTGRLALVARAKNGLVALVLARQVRAAPAAARPLATSFSTAAVGRLVERDATGRPQDLAERPEGDARARPRGSDRAGRRASGWLGAAADELAQQPALADAGRAADDHSRGSPLSIASSSRPSSVAELAVAADHGCLEADACAVRRAIGSPSRRAR